MTLDLTRETANRLRNPIYRLWNQIGHDAVQACADVGEDLVSIEAMEFVLDAGRLEQMDPVAGKLLDDLYDKHGYTTVLKFLDQHCPVY